VLDQTHLKAAVECLRVALEQYPGKLKD